MISELTQEVIRRIEATEGRERSRRLQTNKGTIPLRADTLQTQGIQNPTPTPVAGEKASVDR